MRIRKKGWPELDKDSLSIRIPDRLLYKLLRIRLAANVCKNCGYILDGYPRTYDAACWSLLDRIPQQDPDTGELIKDKEEEEFPEDEETTSRQTSQQATRGLKLFSHHGV